MFLSGRIIAHLKGLQNHCSFHFSQYGNKGKSSITTSFLLTVAWQMDLLNDEVLDECKKETDIVFLPMKVIKCAPHAFFRLLETDLSPVRSSKGLCNFGISLKKNGRSDIELSLSKHRRARFR